MIDFDAFWLSGYWRKTGKEQARRRFEKTVRTAEDKRDIEAARDAFNAYVIANPWYSAPMGSTWFGKLKGWRDWIPDRCEALEDDPIREDKHVHHCGICESGEHDWTHDDPLCFIQHDMICDEELERRKAKTR